MWFRALYDAVLARSSRTMSPKRRVTPRFRPRVQSLEDRCLLSGFHQINLVGYESGLARSTDPNLNGWGMTTLPNGTFVVANAFTTGVATLYNASGDVLPLTITVPYSAAGSAALGLPLVGHPTGVVYNSSSGFVISEHGRSAPALLIFDSIDGTISGWNPAVDPNHAIPILDTWAASTPSAERTDSIYTGLEIGQYQGQTVIYAADFENNRVEIINGNWQTIKTFTDPSIPNFADGSYSTWSVQAVGNDLYVTYASLADLGGGVVDVFSMDGKLLTPNHFAANTANAGPLENPWGVIQAPADFGAYSNDILIGNVAGAGNLNVFNPNTGAYLGELTQPNGTPIAIKGLWDLQFGNGTPQGGRTNELFFDAGPNHPGDATGGLFGAIFPAGYYGHNGHHHGGGNYDWASDALNLSAGIAAFPATSWPVTPSSTLPTSTLSSPNGALEQRSEASLPDIDVALLSLHSNLEAMQLQSTGLFAMPDLNLVALEPSVLDELGAVETAGST